MNAVKAPLRSFQGYDGLAADIFSLGSTYLDCVLGVEHGWLRDVSDDETHTRRVVQRVLSEQEAYVRACVFT